MIVPLGVTVTAKQPGRYVIPAKLKAAEWGVPFFDRERQLPTMFDRARAFLVLGGDGWSLHDEHQSIGFSPGMARVRIKRLQLPGPQDPDVLLELCEVKRGDVVFDGTLGLAADALVCEFAGAKVIGIEASLPISALVREGLRAMKSTIEVRHGTTIDHLRAMADRSVDCVLLDPMFDRPKKSTPQFDMLRRFAVHEPLEAQTLIEAQRVARRRVVIKAGRFGHELARLGLTPLPPRRSRTVVWAVLNPLK